MSAIFLTQNTTFIIGPVAKLLGLLMNIIFEFLNALGIPSIGLSIILFTIVIYMIMLPLTIKQQKFSKMSAKMNPEIQAIQKKYKGKQDQVSMMKMNDETNAVYAKYGTSPTGTCLPMLIQLPILFALYRVIYAIPAYIDKVKAAFYPLVTNIMSTAGAQEFLMGTDSAKQFVRQEFTENTVIDILNKFSVAEWASFSEQFPSLSGAIDTTHTTLNHFNYFLGLNISETPWHMLTSGIQAGAVLIIVGALIIPVLSGLTQWISVKLMAQPEMQTSTNGNDMASSMASSMKMMNTMMPLMSIYFCFILPAGMGIYWVISALVRTGQQLVINKKLSSMDIEEEIKKNIEKYNRKREKKGLPPQKISNVARMNTKNVQKEETSETDRQEQIKKSTEYYNRGAAKPGSLAAKARMVEQFNERNKK
ncbi:MAG: YidC/Oxa1 family membrane protein insertase [Lachnospiraceae bacterium]|nr:YidC/Oxa1 family membrane protein insertase [Lachnospiraceae bacterium]